MKLNNLKFKTLILMGFLIVSISVGYAQTAEEYLKQGDDADDNGNSAEAIADYNKAIEVNPNFPDTYNHLGLVYQKQGDLAQALSDFNKAIEINPNYAKAYSNRAGIYSRQGNFMQAVADFNKAIEINPSIAEIYYNRGRSYNLQGNLTQAMADYNKAIEIKPTLGVAFNDRALINLRFKKYDQALEDIRKAQSLGYAVKPQLIEMINNAANQKNSGSTESTISKEKAIDIAKQALIKSQGKEFDINEEEINANLTSKGSYDNWTPQVQVYKSADFQPNEVSGTFDKIAESMNKKASQGDGYWEVTFVPKKYHFGGFVVRIDPATGQSSGPMGLE